MPSLKNSDFKKRKKVAHEKENGLLLNSEKTISMLIVEIFKCVKNVEFSDVDR